MTRTQDDDAPAVRQPLNDVELAILEEYELREVADAVLDYDPFTHQPPTH